jgi:hypothetical protein
MNRSCLVLILSTGAVTSVARRLLWRESAHISFNSEVGELNNTTQELQRNCRVGDAKPFRSSS